MSNTINPTKLASITDFIATHTDEINAEVEKKAAAPTTSFQRAFSQVRNTTLKLLWNSVKEIASGLKSNLSDLLSKLTLSKPQQKTTNATSINTLIEDIIMDPKSAQVSPGTILNLLTNGSDKQRGVIGNDLQRYLQKNHNSALFSSENIGLSVKDEEIVLRFKDLKDLPQQISAKWPQGEKKSTDEYQLILDKRINNKGAYAGSCIYELLTHSEFTFTSLSDLARKMTMCTHLNTALNNNGERIAEELNRAPENSVVFEGKNQQYLDMYVTVDPETKQYSARHQFDLAKGVDYWKPKAASTPDRVGEIPRVNSNDSPLKNLPLIGIKPDISDESLHAGGEKIKAAQAHSLSPKKMDATLFTPFVAEQTYQPVFPTTSVETLVIPPKPKNNPPVPPKPKKNPPVAPKPTQKGISSDTSREKPAIPPKPVALGG